MIQSISIGNLERHEVMCSMALCLQSFKLWQFNWASYMQYKPVWLDKFMCNGHIHRCAASVALLHTYAVARQFRAVKG